MRILMIEDDSATAQGMEQMLKAAGMSVYSTDLGEEGLDLAKLYDYDLITLDLTLPDMNGFEVLQGIRNARVNTPIMIVSGDSSVQSRIKGINLGADDYMTKPFNSEELVARINALVRRSRGNSNAVIQTGDIMVNTSTKTVEVNSQRVHLTGKEYQMLELFSLRKGQTLTKEMFLNHLYGGMDEPELKIIDVFVSKLRKKLAAATGGEHCIETDWPRGYRLVDPDQPTNMKTSKAPMPTLQTKVNASPNRFEPNTNGVIGEKFVAPSLKPLFDKKRRK